MRVIPSKNTAVVAALSLSCASGQTESTQPRQEPVEELVEACAGRVVHANASGQPTAASAHDTPRDAGAGDGGVQSRLGLHPEQIRSVVLANVGAVQCCYEIALRKDPHASGRMSIAFSIGPDGLVSHAGVASNSIAQPEVIACVLDVFRRFRFPSAEKGTNAVFPFAFRERR